MITKYDIGERLTVIDTDESITVHRIVLYSNGTVKYCDEDGRFFSEEKLTRSNAQLTVGSSVIIGGKRYIVEDVLYRVKPSQADGPSQYFTNKELSTR